MFRLLLVVVAVIAVTIPAPANPVTYDKLAYLTFSAPVQIPGGLLSAGTYRFHLVNPETSRNVLQVLSHDGAIVYAMFHTIPDRRTSLTEEPVVTFRETPVGVPPAVRSLFYGGEYRGYEFVYPKGGPTMWTEALPQQEITYSAFPAAPLRTTWEPVDEAIDQPVDEIAELYAEPLAGESVWEPALEPLPQEPVELPDTASTLPWTAVGGVTSLLVGLGLGLLRRRAA
jgi:LPXTG-motif cell wall-anchored protein